MLKNHYTSLKKFEKVVFFIRRMKKVGQKGWGTDFWGGAPVQGPTEGNPYCGPEIHLELL